ncbi:unnamed protein product, partial [Prorocentrum cordatum]
DTGGAWVDSAVREMVAATRLQFYRRGVDCRWHCSGCWHTNMSVKGLPAPADGRIAAYLDALGNTPLADLLLVPTGPHDPAHTRTTIPVFRTIDDRFDRNLGCGLWKCQCDRCPSDAPMKQLPCGDATQGMFIFRPGKNVQLQLLSGLPLPSERARAFANM